MPTEAMDSAFIRVPQSSIAQLLSTSSSPEPATFPIFNTPLIRQTILSSETRTQDFTLDLAQEQFFRAHVPYGSIIYREAMRNNLPPALVAAVVESESDFRVRLVSNKNAQGLMQVIPSTGRLMGAADLFNPAQNIAAGTKYLRYLVNRFGDQRLALAAYNAGEGNVEKFGGVPPFPETINYLRRVNVTTNVYHQRIRGSYVASLRMRNSMVAR